MSPGDPLADRECAPCDSSLAREGHTKALADLYRDHHRSLLRILTARTGSRDTAKEVLQEAYAKMLELDRPETVSFLKGYLWKLARNLATNRGSREATRARLDPVALLGREEFAPSPEAILCEQQRLELLERAIDKLSPKVLEAFILRVQHGLTFKQVGKRMNIGERMAQLHIAAALRHFHKYLTASETTRQMPR